MSYIYITFSRCRCREAEQLSLAQLCFLDVRRAFFASLVAIFTFLLMVFLNSCCFVNFHFFPLCFNFLFFLNQTTFRLSLSLDLFLSHFTKIACWSLLPPPPFCQYCMIGPPLSLLHDWPPFVIIA